MRKHIICMASGSSRRFGANKLLYQLEGKPLYQHALNMLHGVVHRDPACTLTVVSRYGCIREAAAALGATAVDCTDSELGVSYTIKAALNALAPIAPEDFLLFAVADQPWLTAASVERLLALAREGTTCADLSFGDQPGNPVLFSARLVPELMALTGDTGGRKVLRHRPCIHVQADSARELADIDTPPDAEP